KKINTDFINKIEYILVDEYQDMNKLEQELIGILAENSKLLLVVGDPYQSIYSFKFAHPEGIAGFENRVDVEPYNLLFSYRCSKKILDISNQLLKQLEPTKTEFLQSLPNAENGEVTLIQKDTQPEEFEFIYTSIIEKISSGVDPKEILILVPKKKLGTDFKLFMDNKKLETLKFQLFTKNELNAIEKEKITLLTLLAKPDSLLSIRAFIGLKDNDYFSNELITIKEKYGSLANAFKNANPDDFGKNKKRIRAACNVINDLKKLLEDYQSSNTDQIVNNLFPENNLELQNLRRQILSLKEDGDTLQDIYKKYIDSTNDINHQDNSIRILTLQGSKGLDAEHVYIIGCNDGNIPGANRSVYLDDFRFKQEQLRLLFVGITRAKKTVTISWSRHIPFSQSMSHNTRSARTIRVDGQILSQVSLCGFLQDVLFDTTH
ncbi:TPA: AAA family ATPase, partial [Legionella pneumophila]|nr:AAA family ATPase [Legionella pneumophila]